MPVPSLRFSLRRVAVRRRAAPDRRRGLVLPDPGRGPDSVAAEKAGKEKAERERVSDDPLVREMSVAEQAEQVLMLGLRGQRSRRPGGRRAERVRPGRRARANRELGRPGCRQRSWSARFRRARESTADRRIAGRRHLPGSSRTCPPSARTRHQRGAARSTQRQVVGPGDGAGARRRRLSAQPLPRRRRRDPRQPAGRPRLLRRSGAGGSPDRGGARRCEAPASRARRSTSRGSAPRRRTPPMARPPSPRPSRSSPAATCVPFARGGQGRTRDGALARPLPGLRRRGSRRADPRHRDRAPPRRRRIPGRRDLRRPRRRRRQARSPPVRPPSGRSPPGPTSSRSRRPRMPDEIIESIETAVEEGRHRARTSGPGGRARDRAQA